MNLCSLVLLQSHIFLKIRYCLSNPLFMNIHELGEHLLEGVPWRELECEWEVTHKQWGHLFGGWTICWLSLEEVVCNRKKWFCLAEDLDQLACQWELQSHQWLYSQSSHRNRCMDQFEYCCLGEVEGIADQGNDLAIKCIQDLFADGKCPDQLNQARDNAKSGKQEEMLEMQLACCSHYLYCLVCSCLEEVISLFLIQS